MGKILVKESTGVLSRQEHNLGLVDDSEVAEGSLKQATLPNKVSWQGISNQQHKNFYGETVLSRTDWCVNIVDSNKTPFVCMHYWLFFITQRSHQFSHCTVRHPSPHKYKTDFMWRLKHLQYFHKHTKHLGVNNAIANKYFPKTKSIWNISQAHWGQDLDL